MKRLLFVFSLCLVNFLSVGNASAQTPVTAAAFTAKINLMDSYIASGDTVSAKSTFMELNTMMISVLGVTKQSIRDAATTTDRDYYMNYLNTQQVPLYRAIWTLKSDLVTNRTSIHDKLNQFDLTIY